VERGLVISSGYLYGLQQLGLDAGAIASWTRKENEFTAGQVKLFPERLRGFLSVDPLQPSAVDEVRYWQNRSELTGLKLHLFASAVDLNNPAHVASWRNVVSQAAAQSLPLLIHIGGGEFSAGSAGIFIQEILPATAPSFVQIAHAGGGLPLLNDNYVGVLRRFADHIDRDDPLTRKILFDLSYVPAPEQGAEIQAALLHEIRRIGMDSFLFGSDFNVLTIPEQIGMLQRMGLSEAELQTLRANCAPWVCESPKILD